MDPYDPNDRGTKAIDDGDPQIVTLSGREYERYLCGALNDIARNANADRLASKFRDLNDGILGVREWIERQRESVTKPIWGSWEMGYKDALYDLENWLNDVHR
jgi:hypothetical protein